MSMMSSKITGVTIVYSTVCSGADQRKYQSYASLAFVRGISPNCRTPPSVSANQIRRALGKMKCGKAAGPSGIIAEMLKAAGEEGVGLIRKLVEAVFSSGMIPIDCEESFIQNLLKGKGEALDHCNYHGLKLTDQVMKLLERVLNSSNCQMLNMDEMQFTFVPGRSTTDAIFIVGRQQMYITAANKKL